jgi:hypothetical protein
MNGQPFALNFNIDYGKKTVNGVAASFTDTMIKWSTKEFDSVQQRQILYRHELNRLAGTYATWGEGILYAGPLPRYQCEKAPPAKF